MNKLIATLLLAAPAVSFADYVDVISAKLNAGCKVSGMQQIVRDFNETWAKDGSYKAELLVPMQSQDLGTVYWVGRTKDGESFGRGLDRWMNEAADPTSVAGKLAARMTDCVTWGSRASFKTF